MKIEVTQEDIDNGVTCTPYDCPIALSLRRMGNEDVAVRQDEVRIKSNHYRLPLAARNFILSFDKSRPVKPFSFEIEL